LFDAINQLASDEDSTRSEIDSEERPSKRQRLPDDNDSIAFKNVRCAEDEPDNETTRDLEMQTSQSSIDSWVLSSETLQNRTSNEDLIEGANEDGVPNKTFIPKRRRRGPAEFNTAISFVDKVKVNNIISSEEEFSQNLVQN
jgi:hypothetical protein